MSAVATKPRCWNRQIKCRKCGAILGWAKVEGAKSLEANLDVIFDKLKEHSTLRAGHYLQFTEKEF